MKEIRLTIKEGDWRSLRRHLLQKDGLERQAFLELGHSETSKRIELFAHRVRAIIDNDYLLQKTCYVKPKERVVVEAYSSFMHSGVPVHGHVHSHPFCSRAAFSPVDRKTLRDMVHGLSDLVKTTGLGEDSICFQMVTGKNPDGFQGLLVDLKGKKLGDLGCVRVIGSKGFNFYQLKREQKATWSSLDERFDRNVRWLRDEGQGRLSKTHLAICGLGGVGAMVVANIRGLGFKEVTLVDPDRVEPSNLNRLAGAGREDIESFKVDIFKREIRRVSPETEVHAVSTGVETPVAQSFLKGSDLIVSAVDGMGPRAELQVLSARLLKPLFDTGSGILVDKEGSIRRMGSQIIVYVPGGPCLACQGLDLFRPVQGLAGEIRRRTGYVMGTDLTPTSVATINSVVAGWVVNHVIRYLTGLGPIPYFTRIDQWAGKVDQLAFVKKKSCPICGKEGIEGKGDDRVELLSPPDPKISFQIESVSREVIEC
jgi:molybdopterin/thiamine biosynthesis adenylyltransferase|tara:strand:- start:6698 stop:8143 length:1446 start_codon:yes stop_codon:yes gene_type:complete